MSFYCWVWGPVVLETPLINLGQFFWLCLLLISFVLHPTHWGLAVDRAGKRESRDYYASSGQEQTKHQCVTNTVLAKNTKHSSIWTVIKKVNLIPVRPSIIPTLYPTPLSSHSSSLFSFEHPICIWSNFYILLTFLLTYLIHTSLHLILLCHTIFVLSIPVVSHIWSSLSATITLYTTC